jgi:hypothetical protein
LTHCRMKSHVFFLSGPTHRGSILDESQCRVRVGVANPSRCSCSHSCGLREKKGRGHVA